jgi:excisionase family DNA binding protein
MSTSRLALRTAEVAEQVGVHKATVQRWIADGSLTSVRIGGVTRVLPADLDAFLASHREGKGVTRIRRRSA